MTNVEKSNLLKKISDGDIQSTLDALLSLEVNDSIKKEATVISYRYRKLKHQDRLGILSFEQSSLTENQITAHLIDLINHPDGEPYPEEKSINATNPRKPIIWKYVTATAIIIGILGSLAEVLNFVNIFSPNLKSEKLQLTVFVTDTKGNVVLEHEGELNTCIGNRSMRETIGEDGRTNFGDILPDYLGDTIKIGVKAEGWEIAGDKNTFVFSGGPIQLKVKKDDSLGTIKGIIKTRDGQQFIVGAKVLINTDTLIYSDENGIFNIVLPERMQIKNIATPYTLTISKEGYETKSVYYYAKSSNGDIRLYKKQ